jgi:hypothetical protein
MKWKKEGLTEGKWVNGSRVGFVREYLPFFLRNSSEK